LLILSPIVALMWLAVRTKLGKPALFRQIRAGRNANPIVVPKFRTMTNDVDADGNLLPDELRLTPFGARVRALSLDELPQFLTVLKGEMSLVGPRPLPTAYVDRYSAEQLRRLDANQAGHHRMGSGQRQELNELGGTTVARRLVRRQRVTLARSEDPGNDGEDRRQTGGRSRTRACDHARVHRRTVITSWKRR
jgi:hypothetical protein